MEEVDYISIANNINDYINQFCGLNDNDNNNVDNSEGKKSVEDVLTQLIHMDKDNSIQEGGVIIDNVLQNLTGGNIVGNKEVNNKVSNAKNDKQDIIKITQKELDVNLLEGGNNDNIKDVNNDNIKDVNNEIDNNEVDDSDDEYKFNLTDSSEDDDVNEKAIDNNEFDDFVKHYNDTNTKTNMFGGNASNKIPDKIQIIPMFPYLLRY